MRNERIILVTQVPDGKNINSQKIEVFTNKKSVARSEFYASYGVGLIPKWTFEVSPYDFELTRVVLCDGSEIYATQVIYNGAVFDVIRTYQLDSETMEIVVR